MCRRICVLRERGELAEAERITADLLPAAVAAARSPSDTDESITAQLESIFAREAERVADASALAELLTSFPSGNASPAGPVRTSATPRARNVPAAAPPRRATGDIADFIDEMIAQEGSP